MNWKTLKSHGNVENNVEYKINGGINIFISFVPENAFKFALRQSKTVNFTLGNSP